MMNGSHSLVALAAIQALLTDGGEPVRMRRTGNIPFADEPQMRRRSSPQPYEPKRSDAATMAAADAKRARKNAKRLRDSAPQKRGDDT